MSINYNKVILIGLLTRDPEVRYTPNGKAVCKVTIAINHSYKTESGEKKDSATFVDVDAFGKQAEAIGKFFAKGRAILVEGRLKQDNWVDKNTQQKRSKICVALESFSFVDSKRDEAPAAPEAPATAPGEAPAAEAPAEDDVPF